MCSVSGHLWRLMRMKKWELFMLVQIPFGSWLDIKRATRVFLMRWKCWHIYFYCTNSPYYYSVNVFLFFFQEDVSCHAREDIRPGPSPAVLHRHGHRARGQQEIQVLSPHMQDPASPLSGTESRTWHFLSVSLRISLCSLPFSFNVPSKCRNVSQAFSTKPLRNQKDFILLGFQWGV